MNMPRPNDRGTFAGRATIAGRNLAPARRRIERISKGIRPPARTVEDAQDLDRVADHAVRDDVGCPRDHEFACPGNSTRPPHIGALGKQHLNIADNMKRNTLRCRRIVLLDVGPQRCEVGNCLQATILGS